jgi:hypothetical protein
MDSTKFPQDVFPKEFQALIEHLKRVCGFDRNLSSLSFLSASATCIGSSVEIHNGQFISKPILWCVLVGRSGIGKSHIMEFPFKYIQQKENEEYLEYEKRKSDADESDDLKPPKDIVLIDATMESIVKAHKNNPKGLVLMKDEIIGMFKDFNKYNNGGGEKDQLLSLFNGKQLKVHRVSKDTIHLSGTCVNIIGGVQPERINHFVSGDNKESGFYHRYLFARVEEDKPKLYNTTPIDKNLVTKVNLILDRLLNVESVMLTVPPEAHRIYTEWQNRTSIENHKYPFGETLQGKIETYVWRFCIVLDILDQVSKDTPRSAIIPKTMENAIRLAEYFRTESTEVHQDTFREGILEGEPVEFQKIYRKLENREYSTEELHKLFSSVWRPDNVNKKLAQQELFTRIKRGRYIKTIRNVAK